MTVQREANFFAILRVCAAALVVVGHAYSLLGLKGVPTYAGISIHHPGVYLFFSISGYLLARSWSRAPRPIPFMIRRIFRIFPALILAITVTVFVAGPLPTERPQPDRSAGTSAARTGATALEMLFPDGDSEILTVELAASGYVALLSEVFVRDSLARALLSPGTHAREH